jgi:hypothetical protein
MDKNQLLNEIQSGRKNLDEALARLTPEQMQVDNVLYGAWSVKDLLVHVGFWEQRAAVIFAALQHGDTVPSLHGGSTLDEVNARAFTEGHARPLDQVQAEEQAAYRFLLSLTQEASESDLFDPDRFSWTQGRPFWEWIEGNSYGHYAEHLPALLEWIK